MSGCRSGEERAAPLPTCCSLQGAHDGQSGAYDCLQIYGKGNVNMLVAPSPSSSRGEIVLQPAYFTSSAFVHAARADIDCLIQQYSQQYAHSRNHPFTLFKEIWQRLGWTWIQFKVFDTRSRAAFLRVVMRLFSGECVRQTPVPPLDVFQNVSVVGRYP